MAAGFHHFAITRKYALGLGVPEEQANNLAHFASVYADGMKGKIRDLNIQIGGLYYKKLKTIIEKYLFKFNDIDYDIEALTQSTNDDYQLWHCTRSNNSKYTANERIKQTADFGWSKMFDSTNNGGLNNLDRKSKAIKDFGQGIHSFQDIFVHRGAKFNGDVFDEHDEVKDIIVGESDMKQIENMTKNVLFVSTLLTDEFQDNYINKRILLFGRNKTNFEFLSSKIQLSLENEEKQIYIIQGKI